MRRNTVVIGASAGGVEALRDLIAGLPADLPASVLVVLHIPSYGGSVLPAILTRAGRLPAHHPVTGEPLKDAEILVAPPDHHLVVRDGIVVLTRGPHENGHRPAVDVLFRSAAREHGARVIGVVLSGVLDDGTAGLAAIARRGGATIVQDPADAMYPAMPLNALTHVRADHVEAADRIGPLIAELVTTEIPDTEEPMPDLLARETDIAMMDGDELDDGGRPGTPSGFSCPDCNGVLWEIRDGELLRYRCRVGHAWSAESLFGEQAEQLDNALWMALRGLEEKAALARTLAERASERGNALSVRRFEEQAAECTRAAALIRTMLESHLGIDEGHTHPDEAAANE
jgi:two-component system chemotaxis response regulator CheB